MKCEKCDGPLGSSCTDNEYNIMGKELSMKAICKDNSHLFRNCLTIGKEYEVIEVFDDQYAHYPMFNILSDNGEIMPYRANRFDVIKE